MILKYVTYVSHTPNHEYILKKNVWLIHPVIKKNTYFLICSSSQNLTLVVAVREAPWSKRAAATSSWSSFAVMCNAVYMSFVTASTAAPCCKSKLTISTFPSLAAICRGVCSS